MLTLEEKKQQLRQLISLIPLSRSYDSARIAQQISELSEQINVEELQRDSHPVSRPGDEASNG